MLRAVAGGVMLNPFKLLAIYSDLNKAEGVMKEKASMKLKIPQLLTLFVSLSATIGLPTLVTNWVHAHAAVYVAIVAALVVLHALLPSIFAAPSAQDLQATGLNKVGVVLLAVGLLGAMAPSVRAQTAAPEPAAAPSSLFTATSEATAFHYAGAWSAANHTTESFDLVDWGKTGANSFAVEGHEITAPSPGYTVALGGFRVTPDLSSLIKKTNIPAGTFGVYLQGAVGVTTAPTSHMAFMAGGGVRYRLTSTITWSSLHVGYLRLGDKNAAEVSTGLQYFFH